MTFLDTKLTIALTQRDNGTTLTVMRPSTGVINQFTWQFANMVSHGYCAFTEAIGGAALHLLYQAHPEAFAPYPNLIPPIPTNDTTLYTAYLLIHRSVREKTLVYAAAIDALVASGEPEVTATDIAATWAETRASLVARYGKPAPPPAP